MQKQDLYVNGLIRSNPTKPSFTKCEYYTPQAKIRHYKRLFNDIHLNKQWDINKITKSAITMHIFVMNC